ncbi:MAG: hypothetical protein IPK88_18580 [Saprospiraceae bacterium]|nr:hypothetical protein [Candidatus Defluviibacterium haderslevense]
MIELILKSINRAMKQWRILIWVYFIQLAVALFLGIQYHDILQDRFSYSLDFRKLILHYDHTIINDFLNTHWPSITNLFNQLKYLILIWLLISIFLDGGMVFAATQKEQLTVKQVYNKASTYYFFFLKMAIIYLTIAAIWTSLVFFPLALKLEACIRYFSSEKYALWLIALIIIIWIKGMAVLFAWSISSRVIKLDQDVSIFQSLKYGWNILIKNKTKTILILVLLIFIHFMLLWLYITLESSSGMTSPLLVFIFFILQQCFVFLRIGLRQSVYTGIALLHPSKRLE